MLVVIVEAGVAFAASAVARPVTHEAGETAMSTTNQSRWWAKVEPAIAQPAPRFRGVAYCRHSARDRQENSVAIQQELVQRWARDNGVDIINEFVDRGRSGLTAEGRDGFSDMMENWVKKRKDFDVVLCLDVSRWGRFQDIDLPQPTAPSARSMASRSSTRP